MGGTSKIRIGRGMVSLASRDTEKALGRSKIRINRKLRGTQGLFRGDEEISLGGNGGYGVDGLNGQVVSINLKVMGSYSRSENEAAL